MSDIRKIKIEMLSCPFGTGHASAVIDIAGESTLISKMSVVGLSPSQRACELVEAALIQQGKSALSEAERTNLSSKNHQEILSA